MSDLAVTWWGHSSMSIELGGVTVATDPLLTRQLYHLRRLTPAPPVAAARADVVLVSHQHYDHLHLPSLDRFDRDVPVVVPRGAPGVVKGLERRHIVEVEPGDALELAGITLEVLAARHDGRRNNFTGRERVVPPIGFRFTDGTSSVWYPGDTGVRDLREVGAVDLAAVPIGGWGPTLGEEHLDPAQAAQAVAQVGARWSLAVHYGTFWPVALRHLHPGNHRHFFVTPPERFHRAVEELGVDTVALTPPHGERLALLPAPT